MLENLGSAIKEERPVSWSSLIHPSNYPPLNRYSIDRSQFIAVYGACIPKDRIKACSRFKKINIKSTASLFFPFNLGRRMLIRRPPELRVGASSETNIGRQGGQNSRSSPARRDFACPLGIKARLLLALETTTHNWVMMPLFIQIFFLLSFSVSVSVSAVGINACASQFAETDAAYAVCISTPMARPLIPRSIDPSRRFLICYPMINTTICKSYVKTQKSYG